MKNRIRYILAAIVSIIGIGLLISVSYLQIQAHNSRQIIWYIIEIIILLSAAFYYFRSAIKNTSDDKGNKDASKLKTIETNSKIKSLDFINNLSFWCGMLLMIYASHQLKDDPYILEVGNKLEEQMMILKYLQSFPHRFLSHALLLNPGK